MKRLLFRLSVVVLVGIPLALGTAVYLCFQDQPLVRRAAEFKRRFGGVGAPAYQQMMQDIERRVAACSLYR